MDLELVQFMSKNASQKKPLKYQELHTHLLSCAKTEKILQ